MMFKIDKRKWNRIFAVTLSLIFIFELDSFLYFSGISSVKPWLFFVLVLFGLLVLKGVGGFSSRMNITINWLVFLAGLTILASIPGVIYSGSFDKYTILFAYSFLLVLFGFQIQQYLYSESNSFFVLVLLLFSLLLFFDLFHFNWSESALSRRASGTVGNPNYASFIVVSLVAGSLRFSPGFNPLSWNIFVFFLGAVGLLCAKSVGGSIAFLFVVFSFAMVKIAQAPSLNLAAATFSLSFILGIFLILAMLLGVAILKSQNDMSLAELSLLKVGQRLEAFQASWDLVKDNWLLGRGYGHVYRMEIGPHNMFVRALVEGGVLGLALYLALYVFLFVNSWVKKWNNLFIFSCGLLGASLTTHNLTEYRSIMIIAGILLAAEMYRNYARPDEMEEKCSLVNSPRCLNG